MLVTKIIPLALVVTPLAIQPLAAASGAVDWPGFRGPRHDGVSTETGLFEDWSESEPGKLWEVSLGGGFSGMAIVDGRLFTIFSRQGQEVVGAFDAEDGAELWTVAIDRERKDRWGDGPRSTPLVDEGTVYAVSAFGHLTALQVADGMRLWSVNLARELGAKIPTWGVSASPIVEGGVLLFNVGGQGQAVVAFDKQTGDVVWKVGDDRASYSAPIVFEAAGVRQAVFFSGSKIFSIEPASGKILWSQRWKTAYDINAASPIFVAPDKLFVSSAQDKGSALFRINNHEGLLSVAPIWKSDGMQNQFSSSVYVDGFLYGFDDKHLKCLDVRNGRDCWRKSGLGHGSLLYADGHLVVLGETGELRLIEANPGSYVEKASMKIAKGKHWTAPALYDGKLYVRNERALYCFRIAASGAEL